MRTAISFQLVKGVLAMSTSGVAPGAILRLSSSGWKPAAVVTQPSTANIALRPCLSSDSRR